MNGESLTFARMADHDDYATHHGRMEFGAEATAYLSTNELEPMDTETANHSRSYIQEWCESAALRPGEREIRLVPELPSQALPQDGMHPLPRPVQAPRAKVPIDGARGRTRVAADATGSRCVARRRYRRGSGAGQRRVGALQTSAAAARGQE